MVSFDSGSTQYSNIEFLQNTSSNNLSTSENGKLKVMTSWEHCKACFSSSYRNENNKKVQYSINSIIKSDLSKSKLPKGSNASKFIFERLSTLSADLFNRSNISSQNLQMLQETVNNDYQTQKEVESIKEDSCLYSGARVDDFVDKYKSAVLAFKLGITPGDTKGCSGSYMLRGIQTDSETRNSKVSYVGIFKPSKEESHSWDSPGLKQKVKFIFHAVAKSMGFCGSLHHVNNGQGYLAEVLSAQISEALSEEGMETEDKKGFVPTTLPVTFTPLGKGIGSLQLFAQNKAEPATEKLNVSYYWKENKNSKMNLLSQEAYEDYSMIKFIPGDMDGHAENMLIDDKGNAIAIDGGLSSSPTEANDFFEKRNQHLFKNAPHAQRAFSQQAETRLGRMEARFDVLKEKVTKLYQKHTVGKDKNSWSVEQRLDRVEERVQILRKAVDERLCIGQILGKKADYLVG
jgi:hypothetical protein